MRVPGRSEHADEVEQLDALAAEANAFMDPDNWSPPITDLVPAFGVASMIGLFLARFAPRERVWRSRR